MHRLDSGVLAIDEHIECCAGEANDAEREAIFIFGAKCHFCRVPRRFQRLPRPEAFKLFGFLRKRRMAGGSVCFDRMASGEWST